MDQLVAGSNVNRDTGNDVELESGDDFLISEGLEVLADYRSIKSQKVRLAVRTMLAMLAKSDAEPD